MGGRAHGGVNAGTWVEDPGLSDWNRTHSAAEFDNLTSCRSFRMSILPQQPLVCPAPSECANAHNEEMKKRDDELVTGRC